MAAHSCERLDALDDRMVMRGELHQAIREERPVTEHAIAKALVSHIRAEKTDQNCSTCLHRLVCACGYYGHDNCHYVRGG
jgi:hypothetical protein